MGQGTGAGEGVTIYRPRQEHLLMNAARGWSSQPMAASSCTLARSTESLRIASFVVPLVPYARPVHRLDVEDARGWQGWTNPARLV